MSIPSTALIKRLYVLLTKGFGVKVLRLVHKLMTRIQAVLAAAAKARREPERAGGECPHGHGILPAAFHVRLLLLSSRTCTAATKLEHLGVTIKFEAECVLTVPENEHILEFVRSFSAALLNSLYPGAPHRRKAMSLHLLRDLLIIWTGSSSSDSARHQNGSSSAAVESQEPCCEGFFSQGTVNTLLGEAQRAFRLMLEAGTCLLCHAFVLAFNN